MKFKPELDDLIKQIEESNPPTKENKEATNGTTSTKE